MLLFSILIMSQRTVVGRFFKQRKAARRYIQWHHLYNYNVVKVAEGYIAIQRSSQYYFVLTRLSA